MVAVRLNIFGAFYSVQYIHINYYTTPAFRAARQAPQDLRPRSQIHIPRGRPRLGGWAACGSTFPLFGLRRSLLTTSTLSPI